MLREDYVLRAVNQLGEALKRILGMTEQGDQQQALEEIANAKRGLPLVPGMVDRLTAAQLARLLDDAELMQLLAELYRQEALVSYQLGQRERAVWCHRRSELLR